MMATVLVVMFIRVYLLFQLQGGVLLTSAELNLLFGFYFNLILHKFYLYYKNIGTLSQ